MGSRDHSETCEVCGYQRGGLNDLLCACEYVDERRSTWASNLALCLRDGAALCEAFELGYEQNEHERLYSNHGYRTEQDWRPGCGRTAGGGR